MAFISVLIHGVKTHLKFIFPEAEGLVGLERGNLPKKYGLKGGQLKNKVFKRRALKMLPY